MRSVGIICECNPFHAGHRFLMEKARNASSSDIAVVALMSGAFVQRGETAILDPYSRAELLLDGGADVVMELPFPYAASGASYFANAGVSILSDVGIDELWFGSENESLETLQELSLVANTEEFLTSYRKRCEAGVGTAKAFREVLCESSGKEVFLGANDLLAISYLQALQKTGSKMIPKNVRRIGTPYENEEITDRNFPSANSIRKRWKDEGSESIFPYFSQTGVKILQKAIENGTAPVFFDPVWNLAWAKFRSEPAKNFDTVAEFSSGIGRRLSKIASLTESPEEFQREVSTNRFPNARISRGILFALCGVAQEDLNRKPAYVKLLGTNERGRKFLSEVRRKTKIPIVTSRSELPQTPQAEKQWDAECRSQGIFTLCLPKTREAGFFLKKPPIVK